MPVKRFFQPFVEIPFVQNTDSPIESLLELLNEFAREPVGLAAEPAPNTLLWLVIIVYSSVCYNSVS